MWSIFSSSALKAPTVVGVPLNQGKRQRGAKEKGQVKEGDGNQKFFHKFVSQRRKHSPSGHKRRQLWIPDPLLDAQGVQPARTLKHLQVALCLASGRLEICISTAGSSDSSRNKRASGFYIFNFPFIHHLNVLKPVIKENTSIKSSILPSVMCLFLINLICP